MKNCNEELLEMLEEALNKEIGALRDLLSNLVEEKQSYSDGNKELIDDLLEKRISLLEVYEDTEAKSIPLIECYLLENKKPCLRKRGLKIHQLSEFKAALSVHDLSLSMQVDQLVSLHSKIQEISHDLQLLDQGKKKRPFLHLIQEKPKKKVKAQISVIE